MPQSYGNSRAQASTSFDGVTFTTVDILLPLSLTLAGRRPGRGRILLRYVMRYVVASAGSCHDALTSGEESAQANERCPRSKILIAPTTSA